MRNQPNSTAPQQRRRNDIILLGVILLTTLLFALFYFCTQKEGAYAVVLKDGAEIGRYSLANEKEISLSDQGQQTHLLKIEGGQASMEQAICPDQICVHHRPVSKVGQTIVCLPQKIVVKIVGANQNAPDLVV